MDHYLNSTYSDVIKSREELLGVFREKWLKDEIPKIRTYIYGKATPPWKNYYDILRPY